MTETTPTAADIDAAIQRIHPHIRRTPVLTVSGYEISEDLASLEQPLSFKLELLQHAGSFKARGAFNNLLAQDVPAAGVAAASGGNHGAAVAYAAQRLDYPAHIFVPEISSAAKIAKIRDTGASIEVGGSLYSDALAKCEAFQEETGAIGIHAYDSGLTVAGQATLAREWQEQVNDLDTVLVAVGGAGLISGMALGFEGNTQIVSVEPEGSQALHSAISAGHPVDVSINSIAADSLGAKSIGKLNYVILENRLARTLLVSDAAIKQAMTLLWSKFQIAAEPGGATALAALLSRAYEPERDERVGVLVCGGNLDLKLLEL